MTKTPVWLIIDDYGAIRSREELSLSAIRSACRRYRAVVLAIAVESVRFSRINRVARQSQQCLCMPGPRRIAALTFSVLSGFNAVAADIHAAPSPPLTSRAVDVQARAFRIIALL